jgi:hypothetical protein
VVVCVCVWRGGGGCMLAHLPRAPRGFLDVFAQAHDFPDTDAVVMVMAMVMNGGDDDGDADGGGDGDGGAGCGGGWRW